MVVQGGRQKLRDVMNKMVTVRMVVFVRGNKKKISNQNEMSLNNF